MQTDYVIKLKGTRTEASAAADDIKKCFALYGKKGDAAGRKCKLKFGSIVLRNLCVVLEAEVVHRKNVDIIYDIFNKVILPNVSFVEGGEKYWDTYLGCLRYFHFMLCNEQTLSELHQVHDDICSNFLNIKLQTETDYKFYLDIHVHHINYYFQKNIPVAQSMERINKAANALADLFEAMHFCVQNQTKCNYSELIKELNKLMFIKRSASFLKYLSSIPATTSGNVFGALFKLIGSLKLSIEQLNAANVEYLSALLAILQIDMHDQWLQQQLALQYLRSCRDLYKNHTQLNYFYQLMYYYLKLVYVRAEKVEFQSTYNALCQKIVNYLERLSGEAENNSQQESLNDAVVVLQRIHSLLDYYANTSASNFRHNLCSDIDVFHAHFDLIFRCIKYASRISSSQLATSCNNSECNSIRKHVVYSFCLCAFTGYAALARQQHLDEQKNATIKELNQKCVTIMSWCMKMFDSTNCAANDAHRLVESLTTIGNKSNTPSQTAHFFKLIEFMPKIRTKISDPYWIMLLRAVYKASAYSEDTQLHQTMHCVYVAVLAKYKVALLRKQIGYFFQTTKQSDKCITEQLEHCQSALKPELTNAEQRLIYVEELQCVLYLFKQRTELLRSLLRCKQTTYEFVCVARYLKTDADVQLRLRTLYDNYSDKANCGKLTRLEHLEFAHIAAWHFNDLCESHRNKVDVSEISESSLESCIATNKSVVKIEQELQRLAVASQAMNSFEEFYNKADVTFVDSDQALIDWESIMDDINLVANTLQLMGYTSYATSAWLLQLRIADMLNERFNYIRAATYFIAKSELFVKNSKLDLPLVLEKVQNIIMDLLPQMNDSAKMFKRNQTFIMLCLAQMANYYSKCGKVSYAQLVLTSVTKLRNGFAERRDKFDIVSMSVQTINFRLHYQNEFSAATQKVHNVMRIMDAIVERLRHFVSLSSVDNAMFMLLAVEVVQQFVECSANRLGERISFMYTTLNMSLQAGLTLRALQVLCMWYWSNLQLEQLDKAESKLRLIEYFCGIANLSDMTTELKSKQKESIYTDDGYFAHTHAGLVEPIRRQNIHQQTPLVQKKLNAPLTKPGKLQRFLNGHTLLADNAQLKWVYFIVGCLSARLNYLVKDFTQLDSFYANAKTWLEKHDAADSLTIAYKHINLLNSEYLVNYLRANKRYTEAADHIRDVLAAQTPTCTVDINYRYNLCLQLKTANVEQQQLKQFCKPRALDFVNTLPPAETHSLAAEYKVKKNSKKQDIWKNGTSIEFERILTANTKEKKPATTGRQQQNKVATSQKSKTNSNPKQTCSPNSVNGDKHLSSDYNSNTPSSDEGVDMNACQIIDIIDLDDSVELVHTEITATPKMPVNTTNAPSRQRTQRKQKEIPKMELPKFIDIDIVGKSLECLNLNKNETSSKTRKPAAAARKVADSHTKKATRARTKCHLDNENIENAIPNTQSKAGVTTRLRQRT